MSGVRDAGKTVLDARPGLYDRVGRGQTLNITRQCRVPLYDAYVDVVAFTSQYHGSLLVRIKLMSYSRNDLLPRTFKATTREHR